jgi:hypothetical protein
MFIEQRAAHSSIELGEASRQRPRDCQALRVGSLARIPVVSTPAKKPAGARWAPHGTCENQRTEFPRFVGAGRMEMSSKRDPDWLEQGHVLHVTRGQRSSLNSALLPRRARDTPDRERLRIEGSRESRQNERRAGEGCSGRLSAAAELASHRQLPKNSTHTQSGVTDSNPNPAIP